MTISALSHRAHLGSSAGCESHPSGSKRLQARPSRVIIALLGVHYCLAFSACSDRRIVFCDPNAPVMDGTCGIGGAPPAQGGSGGRGGAAGAGGAGGSFAQGGTGGVSGGAGGGGAGGGGGIAGNTSVADAGVDAGVPVDAGP
jgi:hypothetical protein